MPLIDSEEFRRRALQVYPEYWEDVLDDMLEAAVPERNVGKWIYWDKNRVMCSECKLEPYAGKGADSFNYCPHCGAKMEA